ncbi:hypothetical protein G4G28_21575 [Massilia sp. Dwa41.01b]|uniref:aspartyl protease family protein n=1 Tax=Massilia sp. Dwa41.01b TaxID=2709302 RepID=UPI0015FF147E|nr:aspartyl protease family protein [Massilia sp. Dwa41.01b]QNA90436.1 hypothetical protein G4G28_21575 [Massilia sp. Dwa41.01b]
MHQPPFHFLLGLLLAGAVGTALAAPEKAACNYQRVARMPLSYTGGNLQITTPGGINGKPAVVLFDTGAYNTSLTNAGARRHGLTLRHTGTESVGIGGSSWDYQARVEQFSLGQLKSGKRTMDVIGDDSAGPVDAIVGADFLLQADLEISLAAKEANFFRPQGCDDKFLGYWDPDAVVISFIPNRQQTENPRFRVRVNGVELDAIIDSGSDITTLSLPAARRVGLQVDDSRRLGVVAGIGRQHRALWSATLDKIEIGSEAIEHPEINVVDHDIVDLILGADFLRSHRVLFAMSQNRIYLSYVGGAPFGERRKLEPWIFAEAEAGNGDAQYALAKAYLSGNRVPRNKTQGELWLERAAVSGNALANIYSGRAMMERGQMSEAAPRLRAGLDKRPTHRYAALWLYLARLHGGQEALGRSELAATVAAAPADWSTPIAQFYLGKITAEDLLRQAARDKDDAAANTCAAYEAVDEWQKAGGKGAVPLPAAGRASCGPAREAAAPQPSGATP